MKNVQIFFERLLFPLLLVKRYFKISLFSLSPYKKIVTIFFSVLFIVPVLSFAGGGSSSCTTGEVDCPYDIVLDGNKYDNHDTPQYYKFIVPMTQTITVNIENEDCSTDWWGNKNCPEIDLKIYNTDSSNGECNTSSEAASTSSDHEIFSLSLANAAGGKYYCIGTSDSIWGNITYDIDIDGTAALEAGVGDATEREDNGPLKFTLAMTKASTSDVTINYSFTDGSAVSGTNYDGTSGSVTIPAGEISTSISVPLYDQQMTTSKTFSVTISSNDVTIDNNSSSATGTIIGSDTENADSTYQGPDICFDSRPTSGFCMFGSCMFYKQTTNVRAMVNGLDDIDVKKALTRGIAFMNFFNGIGIDNGSKTQPAGDDQAEERAFLDNTDFMPTSYYFASMFPKGYDYRLGAGADENDGGSMNKDDTTSYYDQALFKFGLFTQYTHIVTYTKGGQQYQEVLQPCNPDTYGVLDEKPVLNECGIFLGALNSATNINFTSRAWQTVNYQNDLNTPTISGTTGFCSQIGAACPADGNGSNIMALPTFMTSKNGDTISIPYSMVISEQHIGNLITNTDANTADPEANRTIVFEAPYSASYGSRVMFIKSITDHDTHADHYHYVFKAGDYWIESWDISKNKDVTIETVGEVRFFIQDSFSMITTGSGEIRIGYHPAEGDTSTCTDPHFYMYLYHDFTLNAAGSQHIKNGYIYSKGAITIAGAGAMASYYTAITADGELTVSTAGSGAYTPGNNGVCKDASASELFEVCPVSGISYLISHYLDAWDTFRDNSSIPPSDRNISTKIASKPFTVSLASLDENSTHYSKQPGAGSAVHVSIYDQDSLARISEDIYSFDVNSSDHITASSNFSVDKAVPKAIIGFRFCATYENNTEGTKVYVMYPDDRCGSTQDYRCDQITTGSNPKWHVCFSSDNFAVRPNQFSIGTISSPVIAGKGYVIDYKALDQDGNPTTDYNQTEGTSFKVVTALEPAKTGCVNQHIDRNTTIVFADGIHDSDESNSSSQTYFKTVGDFNLSIEEISGFEFAKVDADDTPFANSNGASEALEITPAVLTSSNKLHIIPSGFSFSASLSSADTINNLTYFHDLAGTNKSMAATLKIDIQAIIADGSSAENYESDCYADATSLLVDYNYTEITPLGALGNLQYHYPVNSAKDGTGAISTATGTSNNHSQFTMNNIANTIFVDGAHGSATIRLGLNFDRAINKPVNPLTLKINDVNLSDDTYSELSSQSAPLNLNTTFLYARAKATKDFYDDVIENNITTPVKVEVYCDKWPASTNCPSVDVLNGQTNDSKWWLSTAHKMANNDGNITLSADTGNVTSVVNITSGGIDKAVRVSAPGNTRPATVNITFGSGTNNWLKYNPAGTSDPNPFYKVRFTGDATWSGIGKTGNVVDTNASSKKSKRLDW